MQMDSLTMVGKIIGKNVSIPVIESWLKSSWAEHLGVIPELEGLTRGLFAFNFTQQEHVNWVLVRNWAIEQCLVLLKTWTPTFDASRERVDEVPIWVWLSGLPRQYWSEEHFICIGNILGTFLEADLSYKIMKLRRVREGLFEEIHISWGNTFFKQRLDYENIPF